MSGLFGYIDYIVFILTLLWSVGIGLRFGCFGSKQASAKEYLYGTRKLKPIPVGFSIYSSMVSTIAIIGVPSEIYLFGTEYSLSFIGAIMSMFLVWICVLPVFNGALDIQSPFEYYELRFHRCIRQISSIIYMMNKLIIIPLVLFSCCLAFSEATGININVCTSVLGGLCIFYTLLGGYASVIWTDVVQATLMMAATVCVMIIGVVSAGGMKEVWNKADEGQRLQFFNFNPNPFQRLNFWAVTIGMCFNFAGHMGVSAGTLQRYMSLKSEKDCKISIAIGVFGFVLVMLIGSVTGLSMYTFYEGCDPVRNMTIKGYNQLTTHFALEKLQIIPGLSGLFTAGIVSAGLSSLSADANTFSGIIYYDFIQDRFPQFASDKKGAIIMKIIVFVFGAYCLLMAPVMTMIKYLIPMALSFAGSVNGMKLALILLGTTFPKTTTRGALCGILTGLVFSLWLSIGSLIYDVSSMYQLPVSTEKCFTNQTDIFLNSTTISSTVINSTLQNTKDKEIFFMYKLSYMNYTMVSTILSMIVAIIVSYFTGQNDVEKIDPNLLIPLVRPKKNNETVEMQKMLPKLEQQKQ